VSGSQVTFALRPYEIATLRLVPAQMRASAIHE
jgi:hypothetical protein